MITREQLVAVMPAAGARIDLFLPYLNEAMAAYGIDTPPRIAAFLAQAAHESAQLTRLVENLNYSAAGLLATWPRRFNAEQARTYARRPEAIANHAYASRMGNGDEGSGDGWRFRGRGLFQITGRAGYRNIATELREPLEKFPELLEMPRLACVSAAWYWDERKLNRLADIGDMDAITLLINGGRHGLVRRLAFYQTAQSALA